MTYCYSKIGIAGQGFLYRLVHPAPSRERPAADEWNATARRALKKHDPVEMHPDGLPGYSTYGRRDPAVRTTMEPQPGSGWTPHPACRRRDRTRARDGGGGFPVRAAIFVASSQLQVPRRRLRGGNDQVRSRMIDFCYQVAKATGIGSGAGSLAGAAYP